MRRNSVRAEGDAFGGQVQHAGVAAHVEPRPQDMGRQTLGPAGKGRGQSGQALGEDAAGAVADTAGEPSDAQMDGHTVAGTR
jgi:hypothetical protein